MAANPVSSVPSQVPIAAGPLPDWLSQGEVLKGRFEILEHLGSGTVGHALLCRDLVTAETVVAKVAKSPAADGGLVRAEYQRLRCLQSPAFPFPIGYFEHAFRDGVWPVLILERVEGQHLGAWAKGKSVRQRLQALADLGAALTQLWSQPGGRHGDLWEGNVIVSEAGQVRLIDPDGASLGRSLPLSPDPVPDFSAYRLLLRKMLPPPDDRAITALASRLGSYQNAPRIEDIVGHLRALLANSLPNETSESITGLGTAVAADRDARQQLYRRIRDVRDLQYRSVLQRLDSFLRPLGFIVPEARPTLVDLYQTELEADGQPKGSLWHRVQQFRSPDGDEFYLSFESSSEFRKPWPFPEREGLVNLGWANAIVDGNAVATNRLELWLVGESPQLFIEQGNRRVLLDDYRLERLARILVGFTLPAFASPIHTTSQVSISPATFVGHKRYLDQLGLPHDYATFVKHWTHVMLQFTPQGSGAPPIGSLLYTIFDIPRAQRLKLVQTVGDRIAKTVGLHLQSIYSMDVSEIDETNRRLKVVVEMKDRATSPAETWTFELAFPKGGFVSSADGSSSAKKKLPGRKARRKRP